MTSLQQYCEACHRMRRADFVTGILSRFPICKACYNRERRLKDIKRYVCTQCGSNESLNWHTNPDMDGERICATCYGFNRRVPHACPRCNRLFTTRFKQVNGKGDALCQVCYRRRHKEYLEYRAMFTTEESSPSTVLGPPVQPEENFFTACDSIY
jgi:hypothetical protein